MPSQTNSLPYSAVPRHFSALPVDVDISGPQEAAQTLGVTLLPQGEQVARLLEATDEDGLPLYPETVIQMGRRSTKTTALQAVLIHRCLTRPGYRVVSTAQSGTISSDFMRELGTTLEAAYPEETERPFRFYKSNGAMRLVFDNGSQWRTVKPQAEAFRGFAADFIHVDEAGELDPATSQDLIVGAFPVLATRPHAQLCVTGTPAKVRDGLLWTYLEAGRAGTEGLGILDYSMLPTDDPADEAVWHRVYPGLSSGLVPIKFLRKSLKTQGLLGFAREWLCADPVNATISAIDPEDWTATTVPDFLPLPESGYALAFATDRDGAAGAIAAAWYTDDGQPVVQLLDYRAGVSWMPRALGDYIGAARRTPVVYDNIGSNVAIYQELVRRKTPVTNVSALGVKESAAGVSALLTATADRTLIHAADPYLDAAADGANIRYVSDSRLFGRRSSTSDVSPLEAASLALHKAAAMPKKKPYVSRRNKS